MRILVYYSLIFSLSLTLWQRGAPAEFEVISLRPPYPPVNNGYPASSADARGNLWVVWVSARERDPQQRGETRDLVKADHIILKRRSSSGWSKEVVVSTEHTLNSDPTVVAVDSGAWIIWSTRRDGRLDLFARYSDEQLNLSAPVRLTSTGADAAPRAVAAPDGTIWLAWEASRNGFNQIQLVTGKDGVWSQPTVLSAPDNHAFRPRLTVSSAGIVSVVWDGDDRGRYCIFFRQWDGLRWSDTARVPSPADFDVYAPQIAAVTGAKVWVVYAQNPVLEPEWGLRGWREGAPPMPLIRAALWDGKAWQIPAGVEPQEPGLIARNADLPQIAVSGAGGVDVVFLRMKSHLNFRLWHTAWRGDSWSVPQELGISEEEYAYFPEGLKTRIDQRPALVVLAGRVVLAYERGTGWFKNRQIAVRELAAASAPATPVFHAAVRTEAVAAPPVKRVIPVLRWGDDEYRIYFGDLHGHLLMDDGHTGTVDQYYSFARDRRQLDFVAYTPHAESNKLLHSEIGLVQRMATLFNLPGRFIGISGWEWTQGGLVEPKEGHKHVIYETDDQPFFSATEAGNDTVGELQQHLKTTNGLMFAHHVARAESGGTNFEILDPSIEPDVEIASHWGRFEYFGNPGHTRMELRGCSVQDAWQRGLEIGVVGGSDNHNLFTERSAALTAVIARQLDRRSIFDALKQRRCYATTGEKIVLDVRVNGQMMGQIVQTATAPVVRVTVSGSDLLEKVEIIKFWEGASYPFPTVHTVTPNDKTAMFEWRDPEFAADALYYVRVTQRADPRVSGKRNFPRASSFPNEMAWSSPVWVKKK